MQEATSDSTVWLTARKNCTSSSLKCAPAASSCAGLSSARSLGNVRLVLLAEDDDVLGVGEEERGRGIADGAAIDATGCCADDNEPTDIALVEGKSAMTGNLLMLCAVDCVVFE